VKPRAYIGVDPGLSGALALYVPAALGALFVEDMPTMRMRNGKRRIDTKALAALLADWTERYSIERATVEDVHAMPGQGVTSMFSFGFSAGAAQQALASAGIAVTLVSAATWKAICGLRGGKDNKDASRRLASKVFPEHAALWARKKDDGRAEAALLAHYGIRLS
jgi:crossover junction endodeoxyribonuclease RuvC